LVSESFRSIRSRSNGAGRLGFRPAGVQTASDQISAAPHRHRLFPALQKVLEHGEVTYGFSTARQRRWQGCRGGGSRRWSESLAGVAPADSSFGWMSFCLNQDANQCCNVSVRSARMKERERGTRERTRGGLSSPENELLTDDRSGARR
jgi:hypothetical protein